MTEIKEVSPSIYCDIGLGRYLQDIEVNASLITQVLRDAGVKEEDIANQSIHLSDNNGIDDQHKLSGLITKGEYSNNVMTINIGAICHSVLPTSKSDEEKIIHIEEGQSQLVHAHIKKIVEEIVSLKASEILLHETSHARDDVLLPEDQKRNEINNYYSKIKHKYEKTCTTLMGLTSLIYLGYLADDLFAPIRNQTINITAFIGCSLIAGTSFGIGSLFYRKSNKALDNYEIYLNRPDEIRADKFVTEHLNDISDLKKLPINTKLKTDIDGIIIV